MHVRKSITGSKSCIDTVAAMTSLLDSVGCFLVSFIITLPYDSSHVPPMLFPILSRQPSTPTNARERTNARTGLFFKQKINGREARLVATNLSFHVRMVYFLKATPIQASLARTLGLCKSPRFMQKEYLLRYLLLPPTSSVVGRRDGGTEGVMSGWDSAASRQPHFAHRQPL